MEFIEIQNDEGLKATLSSYGATLVSLIFPDRDGNPVDCVLGYDSVKDYEEDKACIGRTVGRVANRIRQGKFVYQGEEINVPVNRPPHCLHGGPNGFSNRVWDVIRSSPTSVTFRITADEDDDGFPGEVAVEVTYTVNDREQLVVEHFASCKKESVLALTHHGYWNLDGSEHISDHTIQVHAQYYHPIDQTSCPTGAELLVRGSKYDLNKEKPLKHFHDEEGHVNVDHDLVLDKENTAGGGQCVSLTSAKSGIRMNVSTSYPVVHIYGGKYLNAVGKKGVKYGPSKGVAIEAQYHSCAPNFANFPSVTMRAGSTYFHEIVYSFSHL